MCTISNLNTSLISILIEESTLDTSSTLGIIFDTSLMEGNPDKNLKRSQTELLMPPTNSAYPSIVISKL